MAATRKQREERMRTLCMLSGLARANGHELTQNEVSNDCDLLHRYEVTLQRINENECNGWPREVVERKGGNMFRYSVTDEAWQARDQQRETRTIKKVNELAAKYGITARINGDPRGGAIRLVLPDGRSNGWDNDTWGIYW
jgi:hypothetical protein